MMLEEEQEQREVTRANNLFTLLIIIAIFIFYTDLYIEENSFVGDNNIITAKSISDLCHNFTFHNGKDYDICDPDHLIQEGDSNMKLIQQSLDELESYFPMRYDNTQLNIAIVVKGEFERRVGLGVTEAPDEKCEFLAKSLLDSWNTVGEKLIIMMATREETICITCSSGLEEILTPVRMDNLIQQMEEKSFFWWNDEDDLVAGILYVLHTISHYIDKGPPAFFEKFGWYLLFGGYFFFYCIRNRLIYSLRQRKKQKFIEMDETERMEAMALMDQYQCYSCPICLEDYENKQHDPLIEKDEEEEEESERKENYNSFSNRVVYCGCDGEPIELLRCGHSTCKRCWNEWLATGKDIGLCPVCKKDILQ